ncbi:C4-dicarboxylate transporter/malic acid transporter, partial [Streptomyces sp. e14]
MPSSRAAPPRLPSRATASRSSSAPRSGTRCASAAGTCRSVRSAPSSAAVRGVLLSPPINPAYALIETKPLVGDAAPRQPGLMVTAVHSPSLRAPARPRFPAVRHLGPNWYGSVMGTAAVGSAGGALPVHVPGLRTVCTAVWCLSLALLAVLLAARALHWVHHRDQARAHLLDPAAAPFYGCLAMALLAVGGGAMSVGRDWIGASPALALDAVLFTAGTAVGLVAAVAVPYLMAVHHRIEPHQATPVWLLPVVAPMVSAALGPALVAHLPAGQARQTLLLGCVAMFGLSLLATLALLPLVLGRLLIAGPLPLALTPTLFL